MFDSLAYVIFSKRRSNKYKPLKNQAKVSFFPNDFYSKYIYANCTLVVCSPCNCIVYHCLSM